MTTVILPMLVATVVAIMLPANVSNCIITAALATCLVICRDMSLMHWRCRCRRPAILRSTAATGNFPRASPTVLNDRPDQSPPERRRLTVFPL